MFNLLQERLKSFARRCEDFKQKRFHNFEEYEKAACDLINEGTSIKDYIKKHPEICDESSYNVLTNQSVDLSELQGIYKPLASVVYIKIDLLKKYEALVPKFIDEEKYQNAVNMLHQMFNMTYNFKYKVQLAQVYQRYIGDPQKSLEYYKETLQYCKNDPVFLWGIAAAYEECKMYKKALLCMKRAIKIELGEIDPEKEELNV